MTDLKTLQYPRWIHRGDGATKLVSSAGDCDAALDAGWVLSPGDRPRPATPPTAESSAAAGDVMALDGTAAAAVEAVKQMNDSAALSALLEAETSGKGRKTVLGAIESRLAALSASVETDTEALPETEDE